MKMLKCSWWPPALKDTSNGDEGWEPLLGDELVLLNSEGEAGLLFPLFDDSVRFNGAGPTGLDSTEAEGETTTGEGDMRP